MHAAVVHAVSWARLWPPLLLLAIGVAFIGLALLVDYHLDDLVAVCATFVFGLAGVAVTVLSLTLLYDVLGRAA